MKYWNIDFTPGFMSPSPRASTGQDNTDNQGGADEDEDERTRERERVIAITIMEKMKI